MCWDHAKDRVLAEDKLAALYPKLLAWHRWWVRARDPEKSGLVAMMHPWESGMDNSPAWDEAFARVAPTPTSDIRRKDIGHVDPAMRPSEEFYKRVVALIDLYAALGWDPARMWAETPFKVADVGLNAILHRANLDLLALAARFGTPAEGAEIAARLETTRRAIDTLWDDAGGIYKPRDLADRCPHRGGDQRRVPAGLGGDSRSRQGRGAGGDAQALGGDGALPGAEHRSATIRASSPSATGAGRSGVWSIS